MCQQLASSSVINIQLFVGEAHCLHWLVGVGLCLWVTSEQHQRIIVSASLMCGKMSQQKYLILQKRWSGIKKPLCEAFCVRSSGIPGSNRALLCKSSSDGQNQVLQIGRPHSTDNDEELQRLAALGESRRRTDTYWEYRIQHRCTDHLNRVSSGNSSWDLFPLL